MCSLSFSILSCSEKICDCDNLPGLRFNQKVSKASINPCVVIEDFTLNNDSTLTIHRYYKDIDGDEFSSDIESSAKWVKVNGSRCAIKIFELSGETYQFRSVENICKGSVDVDRSFFYDLQFASSEVLDIVNFTCDEASINGYSMTVE